MHWLILLFYYKSPLTELFTKSICVSFKKWLNAQKCSGQSRTSQTGSATPAKSILFASTGCSPKWLELCGVFLDTSGNFWTCTENEDHGSKVMQNNSNTTSKAVEMSAVRWSTVFNSWQMKTTCSSLACCLGWMLLQCRLNNTLCPHWNVFLMCLQFAKITAGPWSFIRFQ